MSQEPSDTRRGLVVGQRYISDAEPELGLGVVVSVDDRQVGLAFPASDEARRYVIRSAPIRRVRFVAGDTLTDDQGRSHRIQDRTERDGILYYRSELGELAETRVAAATAVAGPRERLAAGRVDASSLFDLRAETLGRLHDIRCSPVRGFVGPRIELLPHQFFVAAETSSRLVPRVLLADETGLGKTIEAGLILSRLLLAGRAQRVLVLVPDSLVHQWLVELRRRFQLRFAVFDAERCAALEESEPGCNPFAQEQLVLAGLSLLTSPRVAAADSQDAEQNAPGATASRTEQAAEAEWDMVVVDEAHHLEWTRESASADYAAVETIARRAGGLLLLTATPEQLGAEGHYARLRLLDPARYGDYEAWSHEAEGYREAARMAGELLDGAALSEASAIELAGLLGVKPDEVQARCAQPEQRARVLADLIDRHGPGRVMFRNTRAAVSGFPQRRVHRHPLTAAEGQDRGRRRDAASVRQRIQREVAADFARRETHSADEAAPIDGSSSAAMFAPVLDDDPRIDWLAGLLGEDGPRKVLLLCSSGAKAEAVETALATRLRVSTALFHEGLSLLQRDRNAAWFAEHDGARLMICSELGSEGRNFQHAQHLVLFDLPLDPDLVEQRIGRLDRIGQKGVVEVHAPFVEGTGQEVLLRWLDEGVGALGHPTLAAHALLERFGSRVCELALEATAQTGDEFSRAVEGLVADTVEASIELTARVEQGRDRLLEMASLRRDVADPLLEAVRLVDADPELEDYFLRLLEQFHVYAEETETRRYLLNPDGTRSPEFPSLDDGQTVLTFDRQSALVREDLTFATRDHPLLGDAMELLLASQSGNAAFAMLDDEAPPRLWLEAFFVLEPVAPPRLHVDRFLAPTPVRILLDQHLHEAADDDPTRSDLLEGQASWVAENQATLSPLLTRMNARCQELAEERAEDLRQQARTTVQERLGDELARLAALAAVNDHVRADEAPALQAEREELLLAVEGARLRPDSLRLIWQGPTSDGAPLLARKTAPPTSS